MCQMTRLRIAKLVLIIIRIKFFVDNHSENLETIKGN